MQSIPYYIITPLTDELIYIRWHKLPVDGSRPQTEFIADLRNRLDSADRPLYFLSDLRVARITEVKTLKQLADLSQHPNCAAGVAFSESLVSSIYVGVFERFVSESAGDDSTCYSSLEEAVAHLEALKPGLTQRVDWRRALGGGDHLSSLVVNQPQLL